MGWEKMHIREIIFPDFFKYIIGSFNSGIFFHIMIKGFISGAYLTLLKKKEISYDMQI